MSYVPTKLAQKILQLMGKKDYFIDDKVTYNQLSRLFSNYKRYELTPLIVKNPKKYGFINFKMISAITQFLPIKFIDLFKQFYPYHIWVLKKVG